jgi:hypothetical protein
MALLLAAGGLLLVGCGGGDGQQADDPDVQSDTTVMNEVDLLPLPSSYTAKLLGLESFLKPAMFETCRSCDPS